MNKPFISTPLPLSPASPSRPSPLSCELQLPTEDDTAVLGAGLAATLAFTSTVGCEQKTEGAVLLELHGDLGMGKTALVRSFLRSVGISGAIRSPTYTLCEPYEFSIGGAQWQAMHMDLYRLTDPEELEFLGLRDLDATGNLLLVEWPERAVGMLPKAALRLEIFDRSPLEGRRVVLQAATDAGERWLQALVAQPPLAGYM